MQTLGCLLEGLLEVTQVLGDLTRWHARAPRATPTPAHFPLLTAASTVLQHLEHDG